MKAVMKWLLPAMLGCLCLNIQAAELYGYIRALAGSNSGQGSAACFKLAGAGSKYRMGNECEVYGEFRVGQQFQQFDDGSEVKGYVMVSGYQSMADERMQPDRETTMRFAQAYLAWNKLPSLNGGSFWAGRRYYKREDVHVTDFFYWNPQGLGAGVDQIGIGDTLKLSYAIFRDDNQDQTTKATRHDVQLRGIAVNPNGELELGLSYLPKSGYSGTGDTGWAVTVQHRQQRILGDGVNKLALQYGVGPGIGLGGTGSLDSGNDVRRARIVESIYAQLTDRVGGMLTAVYQRDESRDSRQTWTSAGGRVTYGVSQHFKMQAELGQDWVKPAGEATRSLTKLTIAPTWAVASNFWARPELRLFCTYARWNDAARDAAIGSTDPAVATLSPNGVFGNANHGMTVGLQLEGWW
jgi:maltoporin